MSTKLIIPEKLTGDFWLNSDARRHHLMFELLTMANEQGVLLFNANEYSRAFNFERTALSRMMDEMVERGYIAKEMHKGKTLISICNYDNYIVVINTASIAVAKDVQSDVTGVEENEKKEKKGSPYNPFKEEKEKKEKAVNNNNNNDDESCDSSRPDNLCYSNDGEKYMRRKRVIKLGRTDVENRKEAFLAQFKEFMKQKKGPFQTRWYQLKDFIDKNQINCYFSTESLTSDFVGHWCQEVLMCDSEGEEVGTVLLFETEKCWNWWRRITSYVRHGYEINQNVEARKTQREDQVAASKARRRTAESNSQKAFAQSVKARLEAGYRDQETEENEARLGVGFDHFMRLYHVKANRSVAEIEWKKLSKDDKIDAIQGAQPYCEYCKENEIKMVNPDTYLRNRRWEDEIPEEYNMFYSDEAEEIEKEGLRFIKEIYDEIEKNMDKKYEQKPEKEGAKRIEGEADAAGDHLNLQRAS